MWIRRYAPFHPSNLFICCGLLGNTQSLSLTVHAASEIEVWHLAQRISILAQLGSVWGFSVLPSTEVFDELAESGFCNCVHIRVQNFSHVLAFRQADFSSWKGAETMGSVRRW